MRANGSIEHHGNNVHGIADDETVERLSPMSGVSLQ